MSAHACCEKKKKWYDNKLVLLNIVLLGLILLSPFFKITQQLFPNFLFYLRFIWWTIGLGLLIGGIIDYFVPQEYIEHFLAKNKKSNLFYALGLGFFLSACSHGILAIAIQLYKKGASFSSVATLLLASPWANLPITFLLFRFFGIQNGALLLGSSTLIALITGAILQQLERSTYIEKNPFHQNLSLNSSLSQDVKTRFKQYKATSHQLLTDFRGVLHGAIDLAKMVLAWLIFGIFIAALLKTFMPHHIVMTYLGNSFTGMSITLIFATLIEVCSEGSAPIAFEIYAQTHALGNVLIFLLAGVATDYTEIGLIWSSIGKKPALLIPIITVPQVFIIGWLLNVIAT